MGTNYYKDCKERLKAMGIEYSHPLHPLNKSGVNGVVYLTDRNIWAAFITINHKHTYLGYFKTFEEAVRCRLEAEEKYGTPHVCALKEEKTKHSGTYFVDLCGKEFEHFKVVKYIGNPGGSKGPKCLWQCLCECGKTFVASSTQIRAACMVSCGCIEPEKREINHKVHKNHIGYYIDGSCYTNVKGKESNKNSKSGIKGIYQDRCGSWYAKLTFKGVTYRYRCDSQLEAIYKRKELKMEYFDPYLKEYAKKIEKKMKGKK